MTGPSSLLTDTNWLNLCIFPVPSHIYLHYLHSISGALSEAAEITLGPKKLKDPKDCHNYSKISVPSSFCPTMLIFHTLLRVKRPLFIIPSLEKCLVSLLIDFPMPHSSVSPLLTALEQILQHTAGRYCVGDEVSIWESSVCHQRTENPSIFP